jgi:hypothetical protein
MDISANMIDLHFLTNCHDKKKLGLEEKKSISKNDILLYRQKILQLTKNMLRGSVSVEKINDSFNNYIEQCIEHFKFVEMSNSIQNDYKPVDIPESIKEPPKIINLKKINENMFKSTKITAIKITNVLDIKIKNKKKHLIILPKKRINNS